MNALISVPAMHAFLCKGIKEDNLNIKLEPYFFKGLYRRCNERLDYRITFDEFVRHVLKVQSKQPAALTSITLATTINSPNKVTLTSYVNTEADEKKDVTSPGKVTSVSLLSGRQHDDQAFNIEVQDVMPQA